MVFSYQKTIGQSLGDIIKLDKEINLTEEKVDSILKSRFEKSANFAKIAHNFSFFFNKKVKNYGLAIKYGKIEIEILKELNTNKKELTNAYYNVGKFYLKKDYHQIAALYFKEAIEVNSYPKKVGQSYCELGFCFFKIGDYFQSINYYLKGFSILERYGSAKSLVVQYNNLSRNCFDINTKDASNLGMYYLHKSDSIIQSKNIKGILVYSLYSTYANLHSNIYNKDYSTALKYYNKNLILSLKNNDSSIVANTYLNIGETYFDLENDSCLYFLKRGLKFDQQKRLYSPEIFRNIANYYMSKNELDKALKNINKSISSNLIKPPSINEYNIKTRVLNSINKRSLIKALSLKNQILLSLYKQKKEKPLLIETVNNTKLSDKIISIILNFSSEINTQFLWREEAFKIFNTGIIATHHLNDFNTMFEFMESNKAFLLSQDINVKKQLLNIPEEISYKNIELKRKILNLEEKTNTYQVSSQQDSLFKLKEKYQNFRDSINLIYPEYLSLDQKIETTTLETVRKSLDKNDVVVSFSLNSIKIGNEKSSLIGLAITKEKTIPFKIPDSDKTTESLTIYRKLLSVPLKTTEELNEFKSVAYFLYDQLFPTPEIKELIKDKNVLVVPDVSMENTPLEALISEKGSFRYLIEDCNISYAYSLTFSELNKNIVRKTDNDISLYSPIEFNNTTVSSLPFTEKESNDIENIIRGNFHQFDNANKSNFLKNSANSKIIHLATHANASGNPQIQFYDSILPLHELYTYKNNADLVVLSACETNLGEIKKGEGVLSLARGFFHSGANSVVSSLWKINDASTSEIMTGFYKNLKDNQSKTLALNNAKRSYLKNNSLSEKSPYYWASFILIGDTNPVFKSNIVLYTSIILIFIVLVFLFLRKRVAQHKKHEAK